MFSENQLAVKLSTAPERFPLWLALAILLLAPCLAQSRELKLSADRLDYDDARHRVRLVGSVRLETPGAVLTSPYAEYNTDTRVAEMSGGVKLVTPDATAVASRLTVYYPDRRAVLAGNVRLVTEKGPGQTPATLLADNLDYFWEAGLGNARGGILVTQGERRVYADRATYQRDQATVDLEGAVRFEQGKEGWLTADRARLNLVSETVSASGGVFARMLVDEPEPKPRKPGSLPAPEVLEPDLPLESIQAAPPASLPGL